MIPAAGAALPRIVPGLVAALALVVAVGHVPGRVQDTWDRLSAPKAGELEPATTWGVSSEALLLAQQTIPPRASVAVVVGTEPPLDAYVGDAVRPMFCDWLLPRRCVAVARADWVITYHQPSELLPVHGQEIGLGPDANAVRVER